MACVLLLSNDYATSLALSTVLGQAGHQVFKANSCKDATRMFRQTPPDVVICDVSMPQESVKTVRELQRRHGYTKTIALGGAGCEIPERLGALQTLVKPVHANLLLSAIDESVAPSDYEEIRHTIGGKAC